MNAHRFAQQVIAVLVLTAASGAAPAAEVWHIATLKKISPLNDGRFVLMFNTNNSACTNTNPDKYHYVASSQNSMTDEGAKKIYAAAIVAMSMDKTVAIAFDDATPACYVNRMFIVK